MEAGVVDLGQGAERAAPGTGSDSACASLSPCSQREFACGVRVGGSSGPGAVSAPGVSVVTWCTCPRTHVSSSTRWSSTLGTPPSYREGALCSKLTRYPPPWDPGGTGPTPPVLVSVCCESPSRVACRGGRPCSGLLALELLPVAQARPSRSGGRAGSRPLRRRLSAGQEGSRDGAGASSPVSPSRAPKAGTGAHTPAGALPGDLRARSKWGGWEDGGWRGGCLMLSLPESQLQRSSWKSEVYMKCAKLKKVG